MANFFSNLYNKIFAKSPLRIIILGLNGGVGKTTVLFRIKDGTTVDCPHTVGFNLETVEYNNTSYELWDIGGGDKITPLWKHYFLNSKGVIFVIDSTDKDRLDTVQFELTRLLSEKELETCPFLLLANKQDLPNAESLDNLKKALKLEQWTNRPILVQSSVANQGIGVTEGFDWLCSEIVKIGK